MSVIKIEKCGLKSKLYERDLYTDKDIDFIINKRIIEYDIKSAGFNLSKYYNLLPNDILGKIEVMSRHERHIEIGKLQRDR